MIYWTVDADKEVVFDQYSSICFNDLLYLLRIRWGIDWKIRHKKVIAVVRGKHRTKLVDADYIVGAIYKKKNKRYRCTTIDKEGNALMRPLRGADINAQVAYHDDTSWEIG